MSALNLKSEVWILVLVLVVVLVLENPDRFAIRLTEQNSCRTSVFLRSRNPNAPRTSTTTRTRTIPNFGIWANRARESAARCGRSRYRIRRQTASVAASLQHRCARGAAV